jgi:hypothetical protein
MQTRVDANIRVVVDSQDVEEMLHRAPAKVKSTLQSLVLRSLIETQREMRKNASVGLGGGRGLRGSIRFFVSRTGLSGTVEPTAKYALPVEEGSRPHWVSIKDGSPLKEWADLKGINAFALQRSIAVKGTKPHPFVKPTSLTMTPRIYEIFNKGVSTMIGDLENGR